MNHWIESEREELIRLLNRVDLLLVNDEEARQLSGETGLVDACKHHRIQPYRLLHLLVA